MARYKHIDTSPRLLPVDLEQQLLPGTFEHALNHLLDHEIDLSCFDARFCNDETGATAYPPGMLLKVVLFAYSRGIVSSRSIERACREQVTFIALCGDSSPHFTTIANFVSGVGEEIARVFAAVLAICDRQGLIGREMFAIDGVKLPSNAAKSKSGTRADFERQATKLEAAAQTMLQRHREEDAKPIEPDLAAKEVKRIERLQRDAAQIRGWLAKHPEDRRGVKGSIRKSNRTDNESAKMATGKGVIQGYTGVAAVDGKHQIIVEAQAHGTGSEQELLLPVVTAMKGLLTDNSIITADAGYHSEHNLQKIAAMKVEALKVVTRPESHSDRMKQRIDSLAGRARYGERFATVEPVFGNLRYNKGLDRFTLRGKTKVDGQRKLFCLVHNIEKLAHHGYAQ